MNLYLIGSLRNPEIPRIGNYLREKGFEVFDDWFAAGPEADDKWMEYEKGRGHTFEQALQGYAARNVYDFDRRHLERCDAAILVLPAGKSGHLELGFVAGRGKTTFILLDKEPERFDVMYRKSNVYSNIERIVEDLSMMHEEEPDDPPF